ncbi:MAG: response regulator transcription factor [Hydrococcus sp. Prado102]|jgi:DNA-binding NarL/FixJ family response regulator|nr:response regulator transcription factor [Hydrococcus sp. Prado102]
MSKIRVALIEDDDLTRVSLKTALQPHQEIEWVGEAINGSKGLQLLQTIQPDIAIVDIGLPDIDGIELTKQFKDSQTANETQTKILILTLHDTEEEILAAFCAGADSYCMKDTSTELLLEALKATQEGNCWIDPAIARVVLSQAKKARSVQNYLSNSPIIGNNALTERELEVLQLIVDGASNADISEKLFITLGTVKTHVRKILNKLSADDRTQAAVRAIRSGLVR